LLTDPYDVGDRIYLSNPEDAADPVHGYAIIVKEIGPAYTVFMSSFCEQFVSPNYILADKSVFNHSRSPSPSLLLKLHVSTRTHPDKIAALYAACQEYVRTHPEAWKSAYMIYVNVLQAEGTMELDLWMNSASPGGYHDWARLYMDRSHFHQFVQAYIHESGIHFAKPTQPLISFQSNAAAGVFGSDVSPPVAPSGASA